MRVQFLLSILLASSLGFGQAPPGGVKPLTREQLTRLVAAGMDNEQLAQTVAERGVSFEPSGDDFQNLRKAGAQPALLKALAEAALAQSREPLKKDMLPHLVGAGADSAKLAQAVEERGIDSPLVSQDLDYLKQLGATEALLRALREANPKPLNSDQVLKLVTGGVARERAAALIKRRGIDFNPTDEYLETLGIAGADESLVKTIRDSNPYGEITLETSPGAEVWLDDQSQGRADAQGGLVIQNVMRGEHRIKIALHKYADFDGMVPVTAKHTAKISAPLESAVGEIWVETTPGAEVWLDNKLQGRTDAQGRMTIRDVLRGEHRIRASLVGYVGQPQSVTVSPKQATKVAALLERPTPGMATVNDKDGLKYVWIPPGSFMMGCSRGDSECNRDEKPSHQVTISKGFWMGQTEVTAGAYKRFSRETGKAMPEEPKFISNALNLGWGNEQMPIVNVSWDDSQDYCTWAGGRLPTEAEWEYAARAGSTEARYGPLDEIAWYHKNSGGRTHEVGQKRPNAFNLFDMLGNVWEWVSDGYGEKYYEGSPERDPAGPSGGELRVLRGGSWSDYPWNPRVSYRVRLQPGNWNIYHGVRCAREADNP
ncbi:MAG: formylglycine-generating enzyme family protein [Acidobacteria bacterium]|nr:formylglycine-generating enzyme family protein [Acidobacteriota bacterium]